MNDVLAKLIDALREELKEYGEMLALLDQQQEHVAARAADDMLQSAAAVTQQSNVLQTTRRARELARASLCRALRLSEHTPFTQLLPHLPADYRPLVEALVAENNELLTRVQQRARQNHLLLSRSLELMQRFLSSLIPGVRPTVYGGDGGLLAPAISGRALYDAVG